MFNPKKLGDVLRLHRGYDITKAQQSPGPYPVVSSSGVTSFHSDYEFDGPGVIIGRKGSLGTVFYLNERYWPHDTTLYVDDVRGNNPRYCFYLLKTLGLERYDVGASNPTLNRNHLHELDVRVPLPVVQERIASILAAYDDLIENNTRRIAILEEMTRRIFEEWFVHFRAPGCERLPMVDSDIGPVLQGWQVKALGDILDLKYGKALKADNRRAGAFPVYGSSGVVGEHDVALVPGPGIIVGRKGNVGSVYWSEQPFFPIDTVFFVTAKLSLAYVYHLLRIQRFLNSDAAVPGLNKAQALAIRVPVPPADLCARFAEYVDPSFHLSENFTNQTSNLRAQRDLLLPKLISGEIDISALSTSLQEAAE
jgi:type I restriction enzyme, S subunit